MDTKQLTVLLYEKLLRNSSGLERLLNNGARPSLILPEYGASPFHVAAGIGCESYGFHAAKLFLQYGGDPNVRSVDGLTPVHVAAMWGKVSILFLLLVNGGDPWLADEGGRNAFQLARQENDENTQKLLRMYTFHNGTICNSSNSQKDAATLDKVNLHGWNFSVESGTEPVAKSQVAQTTSASTQTSYFRSSLVVQTQEKQEGSCNFCAQIDTGSVRVGDFVKCFGNDCNKITLPRERSHNCEVSEDFLSELKNVLTLKEETCSIKVSPRNSDEGGSYSARQQTGCTYDTLMHSCVCNKTILDVTQEVTSEGKSKITSCVAPEDVQYNKTRGKSFVDTSLSSEDMFGSLLTDDLSSVQNCTSGISDLVTSDEDGPHVSRSMTSKEHSFVSMESEESLVAVCDEYKYTDDEEGVVLLEKVFLVQPDSVPLLPEDQSSSSEALQEPDVSTSTASSFPINLDYDSDTLRNDLKKLGQIIGPVTPTTKRVYLKRLFSLHKHLSLPPPTGFTSREYSRELQQSLDDMNRLASYAALERTVAEQFSAPDRTCRWREGALKTSFTYLLLDPRVSRNLPCRCEALSRQEQWSTFLAAVFYVGKGRRSRPYAHLYEAVAAWKKPRPHSNSKVRLILDVWRAGLGVVCLHVFQALIPVEAFTREAAMIDAIGLRNLRNSRRGEYYGLANTWSESKQRQLGAYLLFRAMQVFLIEGERQLRPDDI